MALYWLVDKEDGILIDVKYQLFGQSALIAAAEAAAEILVGKNYDQAKRISPELLDKQLQDKGGEPAFPKEALPYLHFVIRCIGKGSEQCTDLPLADTYTAPPMPASIGEVREGGYPGWQENAPQEKTGSY